MISRGRTYSVILNDHTNSRVIVYYFEDLAVKNQWEIIKVLFLTVNYKST